jgi:enoyl-[acyl-carrier protein] reductase I
MKANRTPFDLTGKTAAVLGVADKESLAWSIAKSLHESGAKVTIGYQQKFYSRVRQLLEEVPTIQGVRCDVLNPDEMETFFQSYEDEGLDILVHGVAYGPPSSFTESPSQISSPDFMETLEISTHSLAKVVGYARPYLRPWGSVMTLTFQASQRAMPLYGMMGVAKAALESLVRYLAVELGKDRIRINAISAGPVETLASLSEIIAFRRNPSALKNMPNPLLSTLFAEAAHETLSEEDELLFAKKCWDHIQQEFALRSAIPEKLNANDVADSALFLASHASKKMTGQVLYVDCGFSSCQLF